jgi:hypothetical protein
MSRQLEIELPSSFFTFFGGEQILAVNIMRQDKKQNSVFIQNHPVIPLLSTLYDRGVVKYLRE